MQEPNLDPLVDMYGGSDKVEDAMRSSAMKAIDALKSAELLRVALLDVLADWARMSIGDAARSHVERLGLAHRLEGLSREMATTKIGLREAQAAARRDPLTIPGSWQEHREWYRLVEIACGSSRPRGGE